MLVSGNHWMPSSVSQSFIAGTVWMKLTHLSKVPPLVNWYSRAQNSSESKSVVLPAA